MKRFRKVYVEITNICNMNCSFCPETKRAKAFMTVKDFEHIVKQIETFTDYIYLHVKGEPLLHPELKEILNVCNKYNLKINISTNGTLLKEKYELLKGIRQLNVSLHSFEKYDRIKLQEYLINTFNACEYLSSRGVIIRYKLWNISEDASDISKKNNEKILEMLSKRYNIELENTVYNKDKKISDNTFLSIKTPFVWPNMDGVDQVNTTCYGLRSQIAILVDGTVVPCCVDNDGDINLGNIFDTELKEILQTNKALSIKKGFEDNKCVHKLCKNCEYRIRVTKM